jgi:hypothetical protein
MTPWIEQREIGPCTLYLGDYLAMLAAGQIPTEFSRRIRRGLIEATPWTRCSPRSKPCLPWRA